MLMEDGVKRLSALSGTLFLAIVAKVQKMFSTKLFKSFETDTGFLYRTNLG